MTSSKAGGLLGEPFKTARVFLSQAAPVLGIPAEYIRLTVKVITTNLKLLKQQDWCEKQIISHFTCQFIGLVNWGRQKLAHA
jgi:hypothetical protein